MIEQSAPPRWRVHVATAGSTIVRLASRAGAGGEGWPLPRVLTELGRLGAERVSPPRALGSGRGVPILHGAELRWCGVDLYVESRHHDPTHTNEVTLELPPWDELSETVEGEDVLWELIDVVAEASDADRGAVGDGEALEPEPPADPRAWERACRRHAALLVQARLVHLPSPGLVDRYRDLPASGLAVLLR